MKKQGTNLMKQALSVFMAVKGKAGEVRTRFIIFRLLHDKSALLGAFSRKISELSGEDERAMVLLDDVDREPPNSDIQCNEADDCVAGEEDDSDGCDVKAVGDTGEGEGELNLDEIDEAADVFIRRFRRQMMIQKQESFKMYQEMLARGV